MKISTNTAAIVSYKILVDNNKGELIEFADKKNPKLLIFGNNSLIPGFEVHMDGLETGNNFEFALKPSEAFGSYRQDLMVAVPKSAFEINGVVKDDILYLGNEISMLDNGGDAVLGKVIEITDDTVTMDFNHKLADKNLFVTGNIQKVRYVTEEDLAPQGGCGSGCGCSSNNKPQNDACCSTNEEHEHAYDEDCPSCGNPAELRGKGHGNCGCS